MHHVGVDLAWGQRSPTGLAVLDADGVLLDVTVAVSDAELLDWSRPWVAGPCRVGIDAPVVVVNPSGQRPCEREVGRLFGAQQARCHPTNTANPLFADGTRAGRLCDALGLAVAPGDDGDRLAAEVYPHAALVALFELPRIVRYKAKPGRDLESLRAEMLRLLGLLDSLADDPVPLHAADHPRWQQIRGAVERATTKAALRRVEDAVDAVVCAYVWRYAEALPQRVAFLGDPATGAILTPVTGQQAAAIVPP